ncbi:MAG: homoserine dehydrogenase [Chloroflexi bacterium]|nr:homoserine dehydrogenase [Chloroflexota bacterium]
MGRTEINIVLLGLGVVGGGVARALQEKAEAYAEQAGLPLVLRRVLVRDPSKPRPISLDDGLMTADPDEALDADADIIVELMGGETPALDYIERSLKSGRHVVTANKEVVSKHWLRLHSAARDAGVEMHYEASVGGGIPIISPLKRDLAANEIIGIRAIINGTTNYILTRMAAEGVDFGDALRQAQELGYAEADPANDIEGQDSVYKLSILASLAFRTFISPDDIYREGITQLHARDFKYAAELGYIIKLLAVAKREQGGVRARVHPALLAKDELLARVDGVLNAVQVEGDLVGKVLFQGPGAGSEATASAVMADVLEAAKAIRSGEPTTPQDRSSGLAAEPISKLVSRYYVRIEVMDRPGVLAVIARSLGDHGVSIASVIQKETDEEGQTAELVIMTHGAREDSMQSSIKQIGGLPEVSEIGSVIRVED